MKKFGIVFLVIINVVIGQNKDMEQSIELPDFVITGVQSVDTPTLKKPQAEFIPVLSKQFFNPVYQPEELNLSRIEVPFNESPEAFKNFVPVSVELTAGAGINTLPIGALSIGASSSNVFFAANLWFENIKDYEPYANRSSAGATMQSKFFINNSSKFLPGLEISFDAGFRGQGYNLFGSNLLKQVQKNGYYGDAKLQFIYNTDDIFSFALSSGIDYMELDGNWPTLINSNVDEALLNTKGFFKADFNSFKLTGEGKFTHSIYTDPIFKEYTEDFVSAAGKIEYSLSNSVMVGAGLYFSKYESNSFFVPVFSTIIKVNDYITIRGKLGGTSSLMSFNELHKENLFMQPDSLHAAYIEQNLGAEFSLEYQLDKYVQVVGGVGYEKYDHYYCFKKDVTLDIFRISPLINTKKLFVFGKAYFHMGPLGALYGGFNVQQFTMSDDNHIPYQPVVSTSLEYRYENKAPIGISVKYLMNYKTYTDIANTNLLADLHNLSLSLSYRFTGNIEVYLKAENILDNDNYIWDGYLQKPLDFIVGFTYQW